MCLYIGKGHHVLHVTMHRLSQKLVVSVDDNDDRPGYTNGSCITRAELYIGQSVATELE